MSVHVLFVDDDAPNLLVWKAATSAEFNVLTATNAEQALGLMRTHEVGVLLTDQRMPGVTGVDLLERARAEFPDTIRILVTAYSDLQAAIEAINRGQVRRYLRKPCRSAEIQTEIADALDLYHLKAKVRAMDRRLAETERVYALGLIVAGLAHELRNPISIISVNLTLAREGLLSVSDALARPGADPASVRADLIEIDAGLTDAAAAVQRSIEIVRGIELPTRSTDVGLVDIGEVLRLTLRLLRGEIHGGVSVDVDASAVPKVRGSATKLGQVTLNLILNAIHAARTAPRGHGNVRVHLRSEQSEVHMVIIDTGPGIAPGDLARIFDPFFTTKSDGGTGLGLAISRKIIEEMDGRLDASNHPKGGACFHVVLPGVKDEAAAPLPG